MQLALSENCRCAQPNRGLNNFYFGRSSRGGTARKRRTRKSPNKKRGTKHKSCKSAQVSELRVLGVRCFTSRPTLNKSRENERSPFNLSYYLGTYKLDRHNVKPKTDNMSKKQKTKKKQTTPAGFEPTHTNVMPYSLFTTIAGHRLNHSAKVS